MIDDFKYHVPRYVRGVLRLNGVRLAAQPETALPSTAGIQSGPRAAGYSELGLPFMQYHMPT